MTSVILMIVMALKVMMRKDIIKHHSRIIIEIR